MNEPNVKVKSNQPTNTQLSSAVLFLTALAVFAIASIGVSVADMAGVFFASVMCVVMTLLTVLAVTTLYISYKK